MESLSSEIMEESPRADESEIKMESPMEEGREADVTETDKDCDLTDQDFICENELDSVLLDYNSLRNSKGIQIFILGKQERIWSL